MERLSLLTSVWESALNKTVRKGGDKKTHSYSYSNARVIRSVMYREMIQVLEIERFAKQDWAKLFLNDQCSFPCR